MKCDRRWWNDGRLESLTPPDLGLDLVPFRATILFGRMAPERKWRWRITEDGRNEAFYVETMIFEDEDREAER